MKNLFTLLCCLFMATLTAQTTQIDTGLVGNARYEIQMPANWNKKLVLYAHGYESPETPPRRLPKNNILQVFLDRGFATARSSYSQTGWALPEGVDDTEILRQFFIKKHGQPDSTFITGHSMGGGITLATIEKYGKNYAGGLAMCPLATRAYDQVKGAFDGYVVFNALFGNPLPSLADLLSQKTPSPFQGSFLEKIKKANDIIGKIKESHPALLANFAQNRRLKLDDLPFNLIFTEGVISDLNNQSGGNPFDNSNTYYEGYGDDWTLNQKIERFTATAPNLRLTTYDRSGMIDKPVVLLHTTYDQLITPNNGLNNYDALVHAKRKEHNLKMFFTNGQGHCAFTPEQTATAFDALRSWAKSGQKPTGLAIASPPVPAKKDELCYELRIYTAEKGKLNDLLKRFRTYTVKAFESWGITNVGYWTPIDNPDEKFYYIVSYPNRAARDTAWKKLIADTTRQRVFKESEANGKLVAKVESIFLKTTDFSPNNFQNNVHSGIWEFRIYHATPNNLETLLERFRSFTVNRFEQYGMTNKAYWTATDAAQGSDKMLYYFLTHPSEAAAKAAFDKFRTDPEWIATRKASEVKGGGSLTTKVESIFMYPTDFSKLK
jgi:pimeloyl-ACP methyl ester carboxylesterase